VRGDSSSHTLSLPRAQARTLRVIGNLVGAAGAAFFARAGLRHLLATHSLLGVAFFADQTWIVIAYLVRRSAALVSERPRDWILAFAGTFAGVMLRPNGAHYHVGVVTGFVLQILGLALCSASFASLGRSFGFAAANRGVVQRGPYAVVRHPIYSSYFLLLIGYLIQSISVRNLIVVSFVLCCDVGRALVEEQLLSSSSTYREYKARVTWRLAPGIW
jgi:protein-S-isoprenylcysteine O-methyltransferase Ste14